MFRYNEPRHWERQGESLVVRADPGSNFWRVTHSGRIGDTSHFYYEEAAGDFVAQVRFGAEYHALYDQAGLMVRQSETVEMKCGVEMLDGARWVPDGRPRDPVPGACRSDRGQPRRAGARVLPSSTPGG